MRNEVVVREAGPVEAAAYVDLIEEAADWLSARGIQQWEPGFHRGYLPQFEAAAGQGRVLIAESGGQVIGGCLLRWSDPFGIWQSESKPACYLSKLVIGRAHKGRRLGRVVLQAAEDHAFKSGRPLMRLDAVAANSVLCRFYEQAGYAPLDIAQLQGIGLRLFEKDLEGR